MYFTLLWITATVLALYLHFRQVYTYFSRHGVKHFTPIPLLGNLTKIILKMEHLGKAFERDYRSFPEQRFVGRYAFTIKQLVIRDLELIKKITVKDFDHFYDRFINTDSAFNPLLGRSMLFLKGKEWKDMRSTLNPTITGSKIHQMVPFMMAIGEQMMNTLRKKSQESNLGYIDVDVKDMTTRFANDVIVAFTFGLKVDSYTEVDNDIYAIFKEASSIKILKVLKISDAFGDVYRHLVKSTIQDREEKNIIRPDVIHLLMEAKKQRLSHEDKTTKDVDAEFATVNESSVDKRVLKREWSDDDLIAQAVTFVIANFETVSATTTFLFYELALNPNVQKKLYQEIMENEAKNEGKVDYTSIQQMTYLDMVVSEILRLWPPATGLSRVCNKDYNCGKPNDKAKEDFILRKGDGVLIPVLGIHRDPQYFPDPLKFDPERFSDENKHKIQPFSYMPFGLGPRICIGAKTCLPPKLSADKILLQLEECSVRMTPRN